MKNKWSLKGQNRGASLIAVLVTIMFVSLIGVVISQITITNIQMKEVEQRGKTNFYDAEKYLDDLAAGMNTKAADCMQKAYSEILSKYRTVTATGGSIQGTFQRHYIDNMIAAFKTSDGTSPKQKKDGDNVVIYEVGDYSLSTVKSCFSKSEYQSKLITAATGDSVASYFADYQAGTFVLKGIVISSEDPTSGYVTKIQTDMVFNVPPLDFEANYNVKEFMRYSLIANKDINVNSSNVTVNGNVYAGPGGIFTKTGTVSNSKFIGKTIVTRGDISASGGKFQVGDDSGKSNIWVENIKSYGAAGTELTINGNIYVSDDLEMDGKEGKIKLLGNYYGYNFQKNYGAGSENDGAEYSSSISLNGRDSTLNMMGLKQLMLAGRTFLKRKVGDIDVGQADVPLGESLSLRTNQMAYYIPESLLDTDTSTTSPKFNDETGVEVSNYLGVGNVYDYVSSETPVTAFHYLKNNLPNMSQRGGTVYYLKFCAKTTATGTISAEQNANNFFSEFYANNKSRVTPYAEYYAANDGIILPNTDGALDIILTLKGDIMYRMNERASNTAPSNLNVGRIEISASHLDTVDFRNYAGRMAVKYRCLQTYLEESHTGITASDVRFPDNNKNAEPLLSNLLAPANDMTNYNYAIQELVKDLPEKKKILRYDANGHPNESGEYAVILIDNGPSKTNAADTGSVFALDQSIKGGIVIATGDVRLETATEGVAGTFSGVVISGGEISFTNNSSINSNELLVSQLFSNDLRSADRQFSQFFKGYEVVSDAEMGIIKIDKYLTYDNWTKTID